MKLVAGALVAAGLIGIVITLALNAGVKQEPSPSVALSPLPVPQPPPPLRPPSPVQEAKPSPGDPSSSVQTDKGTGGDEKLREFTEWMEKKRAEARKKVDGLRDHLLKGPQQPTPQAKDWGNRKPVDLKQFIDGLYDPKSVIASDHVARGRLFAMYDHWADARLEFERAIELDADYGHNLKTILNHIASVEDGTRAFHGRAERYSRDTLDLHYDFKVPGEIRDFSSGVAQLERAAVLESKDGAPILLIGASADAPLSFKHSLAARMTVVPTGDFTLLLFHSENRSYELALGAKGLSLHRVEDGTRHQIKDSSGPPLRPGVPQEIVLQIQDGLFRVFIDGKEALSATDSSFTANPPSGTLGFRIPKGTIRLQAPFIVRGGVDGKTLDDLIGGSEELRRLIIDQELFEIKWHRDRIKAQWLLPPERSYDLSIDHPHFLDRGPTILEYEQLRNDVRMFFSGIDRHRVRKDFTLSGVRKELDRQILKYGEFPQLYYLRGLIHEEQQELDQALEDAERGHKLFGGFVEALVLKARLLGSRGNLKEAAQCVKQAIEAMPNYSPAYVYRAKLAQMGHGDQQTIDADLGLALKIDRDDLDARLTRALRRLGPDLLERLGCTTRQSTAHGEIVTDLGPADARETASRLEEAYRLFSKTFRNFTPAPSPGLPTIAIFKRPESYFMFWELVSEERGEHTAGVFFPDVKTLAVSGGLEPGAAEHTLYHELFHEFMSRLAPRTPPFWFNEGMAEYMAALAGRRQLPERLTRIKAMLAAKTTLSFEAIMCESPAEFYGSDPVGRYAQAWSMIHFLQEYKDGVYRSRLERYLRELVSGKPPRQAFSAVFENDWKELEGQWKIFMRDFPDPSR